MSTTTDHAARPFGRDRDGNERPEWAVQALAALSDAGGYGHARRGEEQRLTRGERLLLDGIAFRVRARLGERGVDGADLGAMGDSMLRVGVDQICAPQRKPAGRAGGTAHVVVVTVAGLLGVVAALEATWGQYVAAGIFGAAGGYLVLAVAGPRVFGRIRSGPRAPKARVERDAGVTP